MEQVTVTIGAQSWEFDPEAVNGLDAWEFTSAVGADLLDALAEIARIVDAGAPLPFHLAVVGRWLAVRQNGNPLAPFAGVAAMTTIGGARGDE